MGMCHLLPARGQCGPFWADFVVFLFLLYGCRITLLKAA